jgi:hypothetical protein
MIRQLLKRFVLLTALMVATFCLGGCSMLFGTPRDAGAYPMGGTCLPCSSYCPNPNDTLLSGHQPGESKRHADDWAGPLLDGFFNNNCPGN